MLLRPAEPADAMAVARVHVRAWQVAYRNLLPDDYLNSLKPEDRAQRYTFGGTDPREPMTTVAVDDRGTIRGFATTCAARDADVPGYGDLRSRATLHLRRHGSARADDDCRRRRSRHDSRLRDDMRRARCRCSGLRRAQIARNATPSAARIRASR